MLVIRNTFLDLADDYDACFNAPPSSRRSSSVPREWKPSLSTFDLCNVSCEKSAQLEDALEASPSSGASTTASDDDGSQLGDREPSAATFNSDHEAPPAEEGPVADLEDYSVADGDQEEKALTISMAPALPFSPMEFATAEDETKAEAEAVATAEAEAQAVAAAAEAAAIAAANAKRWKHVVKRQLPSSARGGSAARLNALDLCFGKPFRKPKAPERDPEPKKETALCAPKRPVELRCLAVEKTRWSDEDDEVEPLSSEAVASEPATHTTESEDQSECQGKTPLQLSLSLHIPEEKLAAPTPLKLNRGARAFTPGSFLFAEVSAVVYAMQCAMLQCLDILSVEVSEGGIGGTTTLTVEVNDGPSKALALLSAFDVAKAALLHAAGNSSSTYVIGYLNEPFSDLGGEGFGAALGFVPAVCEDTACWDTFQKGFCPRRSTCRWCHPGDGDLAHVRVMLRKY